MSNGSFFRRILVCTIALAPILASSPASATPPTAPGKTGMPNISGQVSGCNDPSCHSGGAAPTLTLTGPDTLAVGQVGTYRLVIGTGAQVQWGQAVASVMPGAATIKSGTGMVDSPYSSFPEVGSAATGPIKDYTFTVTPLRGGSLTIYYAGLAANGGGKGGDGYARATKIITVTGGTTPPADAGPTPPDGGLPPTTTDGGKPPTTVDGGGVVTPLADGGSVINYPDGATAPGPAKPPATGGGLVPSDDVGGCNTSGSSLSLSGIFAAGAVATFLLGSRRLARRRRR